MSDLPKCENCRFWTPWHRVALNDDADFSAAIGHCVIERQTERIRTYVVQGLTGADFHCRAYNSDFGEIKP